MYLDDALIFGYVPHWGTFYYLGPYKKNRLNLIILRWIFFIRR